MTQAMKEAEVHRLSTQGMVRDGHYMAPPHDGHGKVWARATALVQGTPQELYTLWRDIESAPKWQEMLADVLVTGPNTSHWVMNTGSSKFEWDSEILNDEPGRRIAWRSIAGDANQAGEVTFEASPSGRGTIVTVLQQFVQGKVATVAETFFTRNPKQLVIENLRHFKAFAETGEIPRIEGQPHGPRGLSGGVKAAAYGERIGAPPGDRSETGRR